MSISPAKSRLKPNASEIVAAWLYRPEQKAIAARAGVPDSFVSRVLSGERQPSPKIIVALTEMGYPVHLLYENKGDA
jgi:transcriptional regulator with XRE-family HTH domain